MSPSPNEYLHHILDETVYLMAESQKLTLKQFRSDVNRSRAFVRSIEIIGEATKNLPGEFREQHTEIERSSMARMRDRLIHGYFGVDYELVWDVVITRIPDLNAKIQVILDEIE